MLDRDLTGIGGGLKVTHDCFGKPVLSKPDIGAIEIQCPSAT
jgi:hypothetical protein